MEVKIINSIGYFLCVAAKKISQALNEELKNYDLTAEQWVIVKVLYEENRNLSQVELSTKSQKDQNTVKALIDKLEKKGYVKRVKNEKDKRIYNIALTESIIEKIPFLEEIDNKLTREVCRDLSEKDVKKFILNIESVILKLDERKKER